MGGGEGETETKCNIDKPKSGQHSSGHWQWAPAECASGAERRDETRRGESILFSGIGLAFNQSRPAKQINNQSQSHQLCGETTSASSTVHCPLSPVRLSYHSVDSTFFCIFIYSFPPLRPAPLPSLCHSWGDTLKRRTILSMLIILIGAT